MEEFYNKHYIEVDSSGCIMDGFSDAFRQPTDDAICINEKGGYQFRLFPNGEENPPLFDFEDMISLYKWDGEKVVARTEGEIESDRATLPKPDSPSSDSSIDELAQAYLEGVENA